MNQKQDILKSIFTSFDNWSEGQSKACRQGCATCCSSNVVVTATEAELILDYILENRLERMASAALSRQSAFTAPKQTVNEFARDCFEGREPAEEAPGNPEACPFLKDNLCTIYPVRPFACRSFISQHVCTKSLPALVTNEYMTACTVVSQIIEHLGQGEYYGNLLDVLPAMLDISRYKPINDALADGARIYSARTRTLTARPLPGMLMPPEDAEAVQPLLDTIFTKRVSGKTIEDILNGK